MYKTVQVDLENKEHCDALVLLLNEYMKDEIGAGKPMPAEMIPELIKGLKNHRAYIGFFVSDGDNYIALANCNLNFSTWQAKPLINIHDFIVSPKFRRKGVGLYLLRSIEKYALNKGFCRINLEVRHDNFKAQKLYKKAGFEECQPQNYFWENKINQ